MVLFAAVSWWYGCCMAGLVCNSWVVMMPLLLIGSRVKSCNWFLRNVSSELFLFSLLVPRYTVLRILQLSFLSLGLYHLESSFAIVQSLIGFYKAVDNWLQQELNELNELNKNTASLWQAFNYSFLLTKTNLPIVDANSFHSFLTSLMTFLLRKVRLLTSFLAMSAAEFGHITRL